ncbi:MAG: Spo0E family sporulation regulatory protein-aspartic acid phosphatase [Anaerovoracaceae bacterium]
MKKNTEDEYKKDLVARIEKIRADIDKMVSSEGRNACNQELLDLSHQLDELIMKLMKYPNT